MKKQLDVPIVFENFVFNEGLRLDVMVNELVICELKALDTVNPVWEAQILSHLELRATSCLSAFEAILYTVIS